MIYLIELPFVNFKLGSNRTTPFFVETPKTRHWLIKFIIW